VATSSSNIQAVHDDDLLTLLRHLDLLSELEAGQLKCRFCDDPVTFDSLGSLLPDNGTIRVTCSKPECTKALQEWIVERG
jgi:hypothetical protein